ncbi:MAG: NAD(P)H-dependent oxidoreductase [Oscillospiraceae bacterium]|nr:NAD(P)H-dependent oxidoreductase [Oscillospiraceae bacterium]
MDKKLIGIVVGSLRRASFCKKIALYLSGVLKETFDVTFVDIGSLSMYNQDLDNDENLPVEWKHFRQNVRSLDAVLFVTPEYNRSMPPVLKNALDIASRPMAENAWNEKPGAVISVTPGNLGGFGASHHLRQTASCLNIYMMQQPEAYIGGAAGLVDKNSVSNKDTQDFLRKFAGSFTDWINKFTV